ncbi:TrkA family potassium uptake protein [Aerosakkonemataceae cyanobacterium BLCC-F154]|uniref:TrkA family potassium uptake protein n=1 Tax=Floridaenema fluviatile BLCC-F154 TaxID=3153640 RepID=A0ABV4Y6E2_9CYAN
MNSKNIFLSQTAIEVKYKQLQKELIGGAIAIIVIFLLGTLWYKFIEGWNWLDSIYMTVITLATVGYGETRPLGDRGRLFTIFLIGLGIVTIAYIVNQFTEAIIQGYFQEGRKLRQLKRLIETLREHYILCGYGRTGKQIAQEFQAEGISFIIVDSDLESVELAQQMGYIVVQGDATLDETLVKVGIERATCLVAALPSDAENLYTVLSAKTLNPTVRTIARASTEEAVKKLQRGGADAVVSPYITGGKRMAAAALRPQVMDFVDGILTGTDRSFYMEEFRLDPEVCPYVGQTLKDARLRSQSGALVVAIRRADGTLIGGPTAETVLSARDSMICMGTAEQLRLLNQILSPLASKRLRLPKHNL